MNKTTEALKLAEEALDEAMTYTSCESWSPSMTKDCAKALAAIREALAEPVIPEDSPANDQDWGNVDGAIAWHLIDRHADNWAEVGAMMEAWLRANVEKALAEPVKRPQNCGTGYCSCIECPYEPVKQEPVAILKSSKANFERQFGKQVFADWIYYDLTYSFENAAPVQPMKQEPVAWVNADNLDNLLNDRTTTIQGNRSFFRATPLYAAPVRTKDLTDDEAQKLWNDTSSIVPMWAHHLHFTRAVIAAFKDKNK